MRLLPFGLIGHLESDAPICHTLPVWREGLELRLLGGLALFVNGQPLVLPSRKAQALLVYLAVPAGEWHARSTLCKLLWGDRADAQARNSLRQTLFVLRRALGDASGAVLLSRDDAVALCPERVIVDVDLLWSRVGERPSLDLELPLPALGTTLLQGFVMDEPRFLAWVEQQRERLRDSLVCYLEDRSKLQLSSGQDLNAVQTLRYLVQLMPWVERHHRTLMEVLGRLGQRSEALRQYQRCVAALESELGVGPDAATVAVWRALSQADLRERYVARDHGPSSGGEETYGRAPELERVSLGLRSALSGDGGVFLIWGEPGIGKSHFVDVLVQRLSITSLHLLRAQAFESERQAAFALVSSVVQNAESFAGGQVWSQLAQHHRRRLLGVLPEPPASAAQSEAHRSLLDALEALLRLLAEDGPVLVVLDDVQWADELSLRLLASLGRRLFRGAPVALLVAARNDPQPMMSLAGACAEWRRAGCLTELTLHELSRADAVALAGRYLPDPVAREEFEHGPLWARVWELSTGNPFVISEFMRALSGTATAPLALPEQVRALIDERVRAQGPLAQLICGLLAAYGAECEQVILRSAAAAAPESLVEAMDALAGANLVQAIGADRVRFQHDRIREAVWDSVSAAHRRTLHLRLAFALEQQGYVHDHAQRCRLAHHYGHGGELVRAIEHLVAAAEVTIRRFGVDEALASLDRAEPWVSQLPAPVRAHWSLRLLYHRAGYFGYAGRFAEIAPAFAAHQHFLDAVQDPSLLGGGAFVLGYAHVLMGQTSEARAQATRALAVGQQSGDQRLMRRALGLLAYIAAHSGEYQLGIGMATQATAIVLEPEVDPEHAALAWLSLGLNHLHAGDLQRASAELRRGGRLAAAHGLPREQAFLAAFEAMARAELGEHTAALQLAGLAQQLAADPLPQVFALQALASCHLAVEAYAQAFSLAEQLEERATSMQLQPCRCAAELLLAKAHAGMGDVERALQHADTALVGFERLADPLWQGSALLLRARLLGPSRSAAADAALARAQTLLHAIGAHHVLGQVNAAKQSHKRRPPLPGRKRKA